MLIRRAKYLRGEVNLPGDKSISHRAAMLGSIASGTTRISNYAASADCASTIECMRRLGVQIRREEGLVVIDGVGKDGLHAAAGPLDCGNSGTTMRLIAGILAAQDFDSLLTGDASLNSRPMQRIAEPLGAMGARIETTDGHAPLKVFGGRSLNGIEHTLRVASAQIKSALLLAGMFAEGQTWVVEPVATRDHTERMLRWFGADIADAQLGMRNAISIKGDSELRARPISVPADISAASFFIVAAAALPGSKISMTSVGINPTRAAIIDIFKRLGVRMVTENEEEVNNEPRGDIRVDGGLEAQSETKIGGNTIASVIDELPILSILGTQLTSGLEIRDASELRVKESDRISTVVENLRKMDADVEEFDDGLRVGRSRLKGTRVDSFGDHRIAMAFAVAGLLAEGETEIEGADCAAVSFPDFFDVLNNVAVYE